MTIPKLSTLTDTDKIKLLAEMDGRGEEYQRKKYGPLWRTTFDAKTLNKLDTHGRVMDESHYKSYLTSYDAIIPLIQKSDSLTQRLVYQHFDNHLKTLGWVQQAINMLNATPLQLCDALLIATGKATL